MPLEVDVVSTWWDYVVDTANVLAGLGTMGALVIATLVFKWQLDDARRVQASMVTVWLATTEDDLTYNLQNASTSCVYEVWATFEAYGRDIGYRYLDVLRPGPTPRYFSVPREVIWHPEYNKDNDRDDGYHENLRARITFRDSSGRYWKRDKNGSLTGPFSRQAVVDSLAVKWHEEEIREAKRKRLTKKREGKAATDVGEGSAN